MTFELISVITDREAVGQTDRKPSQRACAQKWPSVIPATSRQHQRGVLFWPPAGLSPQGPDSKDPRPNHLKDVGGGGGVFKMRGNRERADSFLNTPFTAIIQSSYQSPQFLSTFSTFFLSKSLFLLSAFLSFCHRLWSCISEMRIPNLLSLSVSPSVSCFPPLSSERRIQSVLLMAYMCFD